MRRLAPLALVLLTGCCAHKPVKLTAVMFDEDGFAQTPSQCPYPYETTLACTLRQAVKYSTVIGVPVVVQTSDHRYIEIEVKP